MLEHDQRTFISSKSLSAGIFRPPSSTVVEVSSDPFSSSESPLGTHHSAMQRSVLCVPDRDEENSVFRSQKANRPEKRVANVVYFSSVE